MPRELQWPEFVKSEDMSIGFLWTNFAGIAISPNLPASWREAMRLSFYTGAAEMLKVITDYCGTLPEAEAVALMDRLTKEAQRHYIQMSAKAAGL